MHDDAFHLTDSHALDAVRREPMLFLVVLLLGALVVFVLATRPPVRTSNDVTIALGPPPVVEPMEYKPVSADTARKVNAAMPFTDAAIPSAPPFKFKGSNLDLRRAVDCLAAAIYYEAALESLDGQMAVAQVVLNRVRHPAFPGTVCGVIFQGQERRTGCQFSFTCDGAMARLPGEERWVRFRAIATSMIQGGVYKPVGYATHYHADYVLPYWSARLDKLRAEGVHLFYRWSGVWGTPKAFRGRYAGGEPNIGKMSTLSDAHQPETELLPQIPVEPSAVPTPLVEPETAATPETTPLPGIPTAAEKAKDTFILTAGPGSDPAVLAATAEKLCGDRPWCKVMAWSDKQSTPKTLPVNDGARAAMVFSYLRDRGAGFEKPLWNCKVFPRADRKQCMRT